MITGTHYDGIKKCLSENGEALIYVIDATNLVEESMERIGAWPPAAAHLGQAMMGVVLLQALSDKQGGEKVSLQWNCEGPFGHLFVEARNYGEVRGTILNPRPPVADFATKLGPGILQVRRTTNSTVTSVVNAVGDVSLDLVEYLEKSEQRYAGINLSVKLDWKDEKQSEFKVTHAIGYLVDVLPQASEQKFTDAMLRWDRQMRSLGELSKWVIRPEKSMDDMLEIITGEPTPKVIMSQRVVFSCHCTTERAARALALAAKDDENFSEKDHTPETIRCEYCGKEYLL
jgi:molecular chaperone Hsp33